MFVAVVRRRQQVVLLLFSRSLGVGLGPVSEIWTGYPATQLPGYNPARLWIVQTGPNRAPGGSDPDRSGPGIRIFHTIFSPLLAFLGSYSSVDDVAER